MQMKHSQFEDQKNTIFTLQKLIQKSKNVAYMLNTINESSTGVRYTIFYFSFFFSRTIKIFILKILFMNKSLNHWKKINFNLVKSKAKINHVGYNSEKR